MLPRLKIFPSLIAVASTALVLWVMLSPNWRSGTLDQTGNLLFDKQYYHDSSVHLALIGEMSNRFPPTNFAAAGIPLKNYHYLLDAVVALTSKLTGVSYFDLFFRGFPVLIALLFCAAIYQTVWRLSGNRTAAGIGIFLVVFTTSFWFVAVGIKLLFHRSPVPPSSNIFMTDQVFSMMINPHGVASLALYLFLFLLLDFYDRTKKPLVLFGFALGLGLSFGLKAYGAIIFATAAFLASGYYFLKNHDGKPFLAVLGGLTIIAFWIAATIDPNVSGLTWSPLWLVDRMMTDWDRLNEPRFAAAVLNFASRGDWLKLALAYTGGVGIYLIGSLGPRIVALAYLFSSAKSWLTGSLSKSFFLLSAITSFFLPLLFNQGKKSFDVIQFTPYFTVFSGIILTVWLFSLRPKIRIAFFLVLFLSIVAADRAEVSALTGRREAIVFPAEVVKTINYIKTETPPQAIFFLPPIRCDDYTKGKDRLPWQCSLSDLWLSALGERRTYLSGDFFNQQVGVDMDGKVTDMEKLLNGESGIYLPAYFLTLPDQDNYLQLLQNYYSFTRVPAPGFFYIWQPRKLSPL